MKFLLWAVIGLAIAMWLMRANRQKPQVGAHSSDRVAEESQPAESMVSCAQCGTYIPLSEALVTHSNKAFCSEEHRFQHAAN